MFIQSEETPNPNTLKFLPGVEVLKTGTFDFSNLEEAKKSNIANLIFCVEGIERVFLGSDFISVTKSDSKEWDLLKPSVLTAIMEHYSSGKSIINEHCNFENGY